LPTHLHGVLYLVLPTLRVVVHQLGQLRAVGGDEGAAHGGLVFCPTTLETQLKFHAQRREAGAGWGGARADLDGVLAGLPRALLLTEELRPVEAVHEVLPKRSRRAKGSELGELEAHVRHEHRHVEVPRNPVLGEPRHGAASACGGGQRGMTPVGNFRRPQTPLQAWRHSKLRGRLAWTPGSAVVIECPRGRWALGKCDRADPEIADSGHRLLELSFSSHANNICILRMGGGEGEGAGNSLSPDPPLLNAPHWGRGGSGGG